MTENERKLKRERRKLQYEWSDLIRERNAKYDEICGLSEEGKEDWRKGNEAFLAFCNVWDHTPQWSRTKEIADKLNATKQTPVKHETESQQMNEFEAWYRDKVESVAGYDKLDGKIQQMVKGIALESAIMALRRAVKIVKKDKGTK